MKKLKIADEMLIGPEFEFHLIDNMSYSINPNEVSFKLNVTEQRFNVFVGAGSDYNNTTFIDTGSVLTDNMIVNISTNDGDYIFIKVGKNEIINNFATYVSAGSPFNYTVALDNPVNIDENYKYYKSTNRFRVSTGNYIINKTN